MQECPEIDYVLKGEAEAAIQKLCLAQEKKQGFSGIKGMLFRESGFIKDNGLSDAVSDLDKLAPPARELVEALYDSRKYYIVLTRQRPVETIITSRGCPFQCRFCCNTTKAYRGRSPENVVEEIASRYARGIRVFDIADANFTFDRERAMKIFRLIKRRPENFFQV